MGKPGPPILIIQLRINSAALESPIFPRLNSLSKALFLLGEVDLVLQVLVDLLPELGLELLCGLQAVVRRAEQGTGHDQVVSAQVEVCGGVPSPESPEAQFAGGTGRDPAPMIKVKGHSLSERPLEKKQASMQRTKD